MMFELHLAELFLLLLWAVLAALAFWRLAQHKEKISQKRRIILGLCIIFLPCLGALISLLATAPTAKEPPHRQGR